MNTPRIVVYNLFGNTRDELEEAALRAGIAFFGPDVVLQINPNWSAGRRRISDGSLEPEKKLYADIVVGLAEPVDPFENAIKFGAVVSAGCAEDLEGKALQQAAEAFFSRDMIFRVVENYGIAQNRGSVAEREGKYYALISVLCARAPHANDLVQKYADEELKSQD